MIYDRATRKVRRGDAFDRRLDAVAVPVLLDAGFHEAEPYCMRRGAGQGDDAVWFCITPRFFLVEVSYWPRSMREIGELFELDEPRDVPAPLYVDLLTPKGVFSPGRTSGRFRCGTARDRDRSLAAVAAALPAHALPHLEAIRDPAAYARNVEADAVMFKARALEVAGDLGGARAAYAEMLRRARGSIESNGSVSRFVRTCAASDGQRGTLHSFARAFVYCCLKLQEDLERCAEAQRLTGYRPAVAPLGKG